MKLKEVEITLDRQSMVDIGEVAEEIVYWAAQRPGLMAWVESWELFLNGESEVRPDSNFNINDWWFLSIDEARQPVFSLGLKLSNSQSVWVGFTEIANET